MFGGLALWVPLLFLVVLAAKFWMEPRDYRLRSVAIVLLISAPGLIAIVATYGSISGIEPGISIIALLMSVKILEAHTAREFHIMVMVGFILCLCGFFLSQDLAIALSLLTGFVLLLAALIQFHCGGSCRFWFPMRSAIKLILQAMPLILLLFLLFPRVSTGFRFQLGQGQGAGAGFSGRLSAGSVASLVHSSAIAFRVEFPNGNIPPSSALYWRGVVMNRGDGFEWRAPNAPAALPRKNQSAPAAGAIRQTITLEPHNERWMFALDWPVSAPPGSTLSPGNYIWSGQPIKKLHRYEVVSYPEIPDRQLHERERVLALQLPKSIGAGARALVKSWKQENPSPHFIANRALEFFRTQGFRYSLSPGEYGKNDLDEFLFQRRLGFCEHYAAAFATLMRLAGVPARVVAGYLGGEYNEIGNFLLVRQSDAHAWCEIWLPDSGWTRIDPTAAVAPDRVNLGLNSFLERPEINGVQAGKLSLLRRSALFNRVRLAWQTLNYAWDKHVLSFDSDAQEAMLGSMGFSNTLVPFAAGIVVIFVVLVAYSVWMRRRSRPARDCVQALYESFCRKAATLGAARIPTEGPIDFSNRARQILPVEAGRIQRIIDSYIALRYSAHAHRDILDHFATSVRTFCR